MEPVNETVAPSTVSKSTIAPFDLKKLEYGVEILMDPKLDIDEVGSDIISEVQSWGDRVEAAESILDSPSGPIEDEEPMDLDISLPPSGSVHSVPIISKSPKPNKKKKGSGKGGKK